MIALVIAAAPAHAQDIVMRRPLPIQARAVGPTPATTPTSTPDTTTRYHGWQPACSEETPTAACVSIGPVTNTVVDASECPATQDAAGEALAHRNGLFGMLDGIGAANRASVCGPEPDAPTSFYVASGTCQGGYRQVECTQAFVDSAGATTARQATLADRCASQPDTPAFKAVVTGPSGVALTGDSFIAPDMVYTVWGAPCSPDTNPANTKVAGGQCTGDGGFACTIFDVAKGGDGKYSIAKAMPADPGRCYGSGTSDQVKFVKSLGYYVPTSYSDSPADYCRNYDTFGATSECGTTVAQRPDGGYDINTGLDLQCFGIRASPWDPDSVYGSKVATARCDAAPLPTAAQLDMIAKARLLPYEQARSKDCGLTANINYNYQWKVLPGDWNVKRSTRTYQYPTAETRAARVPHEGDSYGEYTDWTYEGTFSLSAVCTDIAPKEDADDGDASYWDGPYDDPIYQENHTKPVESKIACSTWREVITGPYFYLHERVLASVGERWAFEPHCYEPSYGLKDRTEITVGGDGMTLNVNRCSPASARYFIFRDGQWQMYATAEGNPQR